MRPKDKFIAMAAGSFACLIGLLQLATLHDRPSASTEVVETKQPPRAANPSPRSVPARPVQSAGSAYAERIQTYWLPEVATLPSSAPDDDLEFARVWLKLDDLIQDVVDGARLNLTPVQAKARNALVAAISRKQTVLFPSMRAAYAQHLRAKLFRDDVDVSAIGPRNSTLRQTGGAFSLNSNIEDDEQASRGVLARLRFRRSEYRWSRYLGDGYHYDYKAPADDAVRAWDGGVDEWKPIDNGPSLSLSKTVTSEPHKRDPACVPKLAAQVGMHC